MRFTLSDAFRQYLASAGPRTLQEIRRAISTKYPGKWKESGMQTELYGCSVNRPKAYKNFPSSPKCLYYDHNTRTYELYSVAKHGPNVWDPAGRATPLHGGQAVGPENGQLKETTIRLDLEDHLRKHLDSIEQGLQLAAEEHSPAVGRINILAKDGQGTCIPIHIVVGEATETAVGQVLKHMGFLQETNSCAPRGILIAGDFSQAARYAAALIPNLRLLKYSVSFSLEKS